MPAEEKVAASKPSAEEKAVAPRRTVKARTRMENIAMLPDGTPDEKRSWVVNEGDMVPVDHPAVALHPTHFEGV